MIFIASLLLEREYNKSKSKKSQNNTVIPLDDGTLYENEY